MEASVVDVVGSVYQPDRPGLPKLAVVFVEDELRASIRIKDGTDGEALVHRLVREYEESEHDR
jgi:hypothetical protein